MIRGVVEIDATGSRASYGLLTPSAFANKIYDDARRRTLENITIVMDEGEQAAAIWSPSNSLPEIAARASRRFDPKEVTLVYVERPKMRWRELTGPFVNISV